MGMWIALEDAKRDNGCMFAFPGSHKTPTDYFLKLNKDRKTTSYHGNEPNYESKYNVEEAACLEVPKVINDFNYLILRVPWFVYMEI